jgi:hypothetical protein
LFALASLDDLRHGIPIVEEPGELIGEFWIPRYPGLPIDRLALVEVIEIVCQNLVDRNGFTGRGHG